MAYRSDLEASRQRERACEAELAEHRARKQRVADLEAEVEAAQREVYRRTLPVLSNLRVANPCGESWHDMEGSERVRHCGRCRNAVYNLSGMTRAEAIELLAGRRAPVCVRYYRRLDGTVMTRDCRRNSAWIITAGVVAVVAVVVGAFLYGPEPVTMGEALPASAVEGSADPGDAR